MSVSSFRAKFQLKLNLIVSHRLWLQYGPINVLIMTFWYLSWVRPLWWSWSFIRRDRGRATKHETNQEAILQRVNWYFGYRIEHTKKIRLILRLSSCQWQVYAIHISFSHSSFSINNCTQTLLFVQYLYRSQHW